MIPIAIHVDVRSSVEVVVVPVVLIAAGMALATIYRLVWLRLHETPDRGALLQSLGTWWVLAAAFSVAMLLGEAGILALLGIVNLIAFREYLLVIGAKAAPRGALVVAWLLVPLQYLAIASGPLLVMHVMLPIATLVLSVGCLLFGRRDDVNGLRREVFFLGIGLLVVVYGFSHAGMLMRVPGGAGMGAAGTLGLFWCLVVLTECNDIAQSFWGKAIGKRRVTPRISPHKTWEGLVGGVSTTVLLSMLLAPWLVVSEATWSTVIESAFASGFLGLTIGLVGFAGDVTMSAVKRTFERKDFSSLLPGQGGMLDRIDSLTLSGPVFYHLVYLSHWA